MTIQISSFDELMRFIESNDLTPKQLNALIIHSLRVYYFEEIPKAELIQKLKEYWGQYEDNIEKPLFL